MGGLTNYFIRRVLLMVPTFLGITLMTFMVLQIVPGGPLEQEIMKLRMGAAAMGGAGDFGATADVGVGMGTSQFGGVQLPQEAMEEMKKFYGMDKPIHMRYLTWLWRVMKLDFGTSYTYAEPVLQVIKGRLSVSAYFGLLGFLATYSVCIPLGVAKAIKHGSKFDTVSSILVFVGYSIPGWALGAILLVLLGGGSFWDVFPLGEFRSENFADLSLWGKIVDQVYHTILPGIAWTITGFASLTVLMKNSLIENLAQDYVRTAFAKGLTEKRVVFVHALRNSLIPLATGIGHLIGLFLAGSYLIEKTFNIDGIGLLSYEALLNRDYPIALGFLVIGSIIRLLGNMLSDVAYAVIDPRIRFR